MVCKDCITGALHEGTPVGRVETIHGLPTYISEPPSGQAPQGLIVIIPDAFGWEFNNNRILADSYAKRTNSLVYLPEFMNGYAMDPSLFLTMDIIMGNGWKIGKIIPIARAISAFAPFLFFNRQAVTKPRIYKFLDDLRINEAASLPVGAAGFCWGGRYVFLLSSDSEKAANGKSLVDCGFAAHPSNVVVPAEVEPVNLPLSISVGDVDLAMPLAQVQRTKEILEKKGKDIHEVIIIPGAKHGFAIRADPSDEKAVDQGKQAETQAVDWFTKWFEKAPK